MGDNQRAKMYLGNVLFLLPDIDVRDYNQKMRLIQSIVGQVSVYSNRNDESLKMSNDIHEYARLGTCPTGSVDVIFGDVYYCGKYYENYIPGVSTGKFSKLGNERLWNETKTLLVGDNSDKS